ncbi:MAG: hypothetical protein AABW56_03930 [Nanoarchaeota archaeon]
MKIKGYFLEKQFEVKNKGKVYYISYLNSTSQSLRLLNRDNWEIYEEDGDNLFEYIYKRNKFVLDKNIRKLKLKLIKRCIKNFNKYHPKYERY